MQEALIVKADAHGDLGLRHSASEEVLRERDAAMRDIGVRREADLLAKRAAKAELVREPLPTRPRARRAGRVVHAVGDEGDPMRSIAEVIGRVLRLPVQAVPAETFGFLGNVFALDQPSSSAWTRDRFEWRPTHPSLLADLEAGNYPA
jgi:hypothetical protein